MEGRSSKCGLPEGVAPKETSYHLSEPKYNAGLGAVIKRQDRGEDDEEEYTRKRRRVCRFECVRKRRACEEPNAEERILKRRRIA